MDNGTKFAVIVALGFCLAVVVLVGRGCRNEKEKEAGKGTFYKNIEFLDCSGVKFAPDDGDSLYCGGQYVRILGFDTPETIHVEHGIMHEQRYGRQAKDYVIDLLQKAKVITVVHQRGAIDKYQRLLGHVLIDGHLLAPMIIRAGLAYEAIDYYGDQGFSEYAAEIMVAWNDVAKPLPFVSPHEFRQCEQKGECTEAILLDRVANPAP